MIAHLELLLFRFILSLKRTIFSLLLSEFTLSVAAFIGTGNITENMAIFS